MKQYLLRISGLAALILMGHAAAFAQDNEDRDTLNAKGGHGDNETIIIKSRDDKDVKLNVEIKDGKVFINGKPMEEFKGEGVTVRKMRSTGDGDAWSLIGDEDQARVYENLVGPRSPFRNQSKVFTFSPADTNRPFLGVSSTREDDVEGAKIEHITKGSAAEKAGLKLGDLITRVNDIKISDPEDLTDAVHKFKPQDKVTITYKREGKEEKTTASLGRMKSTYSFNYNYRMPKMENFNFNMPHPEMAPMPRAYSFSYSERRPKLGIKAQDTEDGKGVKVLDIDEDSPADKAGIKEGDIITHFDGKAVNSAAELADQARESKDKNEFKLNLIHEGKAREVDVKIPKKLKTAEL
ncbi:MAG: PDZ domain-containing protein [Bacteroidota bacterium]|nr:PDZ domain-containing protein [Bacteroidota bacterium]MDP4253981.1 PDZ domain-containing protein [Bacteroidota bacterium]MDP4257999.1 PDZ domain-containing protein [Bacteroidota bacterium]